MPKPNHKLIAPPTPLLPANQNQPRRDPRDWMTPGPNQPRGVANFPGSPPPLPVSPSGPGPNRVQNPSTPTGRHPHHRQMPATLISLQVARQPIRTQHPMHLWIFQYRITRKTQRRHRHRDSSLIQLLCIIGHRRVQVMTQLRVMQTRRSQRHSQLSRPVTVGTTVSACNRQRVRNRLHRPPALHCAMGRYISTRPGNRCAAQVREVRLPQFVNTPRTRHHRSITPPATPAVTAPPIVPPAPVNQPAVPPPVTELPPATTPTQALPITPGSTLRKPSWLQALLTGIGPSWTPATLHDWLIRTG